MINKRSLWFLTLFCLILVLSIYYVTMPSELLITPNNTKEEIEEVKETGKVEESSFLVALRIEAEEKFEQKLNDLQAILTNSKSTTEEKNNAYEQIKELNSDRGEEEKIEKQIKDNLSLEAFVKKEGDKIQVVINSDKHDTSLANTIMRLVQKNYQEQMYITVKFQT